jgi:hypothetical protein
MSDKDKDGLSNQETDDLLASLNQRASSNTDSASQEEEEGGEDIEAFLADLETGDEAGAVKPGGEQKEEPDPFADAFAELESIHGDDVDAEFEAKYAALEAEADEEETPAPKPTKREPEPEPHKPPPEAKAPAKESAPEEEEEEEQADAKADKKGKKKKKKKDGEIAVVQSQQSKKVTFAIGAMKWSLLLLPVMLSWWLIGAFLGEWLETGWLIAIAATVGAFILPLILKLAIRRGKWAYYAAALGVLTVAALVAPWPDTAGKRLAHYGHWPVTTVAQLAGWQPDHAAVKMTAWGAEVIGQQVEKIAPAKAATETTEGAEEKETLARALGTEKELVSFAEAQRVEAAKEKEKAAEEKPARDDGEKASEEKEEVKEEKPAEEKSEKSEKSEEK